MKRRSSARRPSTPEGVVRLWDRAREDARVLFTDAEAGRRYVLAVLDDHGLDVVDAIRARRWLRGRRR